MDNKPLISESDSRVNHQIKRKHSASRKALYAIMQQEEGDYNDFKT